MLAEFHLRVLIVIFIVALWSTVSTKPLSRVSSLPSNTLALYTLLADDDHTDYTSDTDYEPRLYPYQMEAFNLFFLTFVNPQTMPSIPISFINFAMCRGSGKPGCPNDDQLIIFSIGGLSYSQQTWLWLDTPQSASDMAEQVILWFTDYGINGIDIDIETGAGDDPNAAQNVLVFVNTLKLLLQQLNIDGLITVPVFGFPQIDAQNALVNNCFNVNGSCYNEIDSIGIEYYVNLESLIYVPNYANATSQWVGFPITCDVPKLNILAGIQGIANSSIITKMARDAVNEQLGGVMVWYASVYDQTREKNGLTYYPSDPNDATTKMNETARAWRDAERIILESAM